MLRKVSIISVIIISVFLSFFSFHKKEKAIEETVQNTPRGIAYNNGRIVNLAVNGAWVWHTDPVTIWNKKRLFFSYVDSEKKKIMMSSYDPLLESIYPIEVSTKNSSARDSHDHPSFAKLPDGNLYISYNRHGADSGFFYRRSLKSNPETIEDLSEESFYNYDSETFSCYSNTYYLSETGELHTFLRWLDNKPTWLKSIDLGESWSDPLKFLENNAIRPYVHYNSNGKDRIDMIYSDGHPRKQKNSVYHIYYKDNNFYKSSDELITSAENLPIDNDSDLQKGTYVYKYSEEALTKDFGIDDWIPFGRAWIWDLEYSKDGNPVSVFSVSLKPESSKDWEQTRIFYYYAWWTEENGWKKKMIAGGGNALYKEEDDFAGGISIDPGDTSVVYFSSNAVNPLERNIAYSSIYGNDDYKLYRGEFDLETESFELELFVESPGNLVIRPFVARGENGEEAVLWMEGKNYRDMINYNTGIKGWFNNF